MPARPRSAMTSPIGANSPRLDCIAYFPMLLRQEPSTALCRFALSAESRLRQVVGGLETHPEIGVRPTGRFEL